MPSENFLYAFLVEDVHPLFNSEFLFQYGGPNPLCRPTPAPFQRVKCLASLHVRQVLKLHEFFGKLCLWLLDYKKSAYSAEELLSFLPCKGNGAKQFPGWIGATPRGRYIPTERVVYFLENIRISVDDIYPKKRPPLLPSHANINTSLSVEKTGHIFVTKHAISIACLEG